MRKRVLILAVIIAAIVVPLDVALSLEETPLALTPARSESLEVSSRGPVLLDISHPVAIFQPALPFKRRVPDSAGLFVLGTVLIGLAIAVRRAT